MKFHQLKSQSQPKKSLILVNQRKKISAVTQSQTTTFPRDKKVSLKALKIANYTCEIDAQHQTFIRKKDDLPYTEPHHLVPMAYSDDFDVL